MAVVSKVDCRIEATETGTADLGTPKMAHVFQYLLSLASGTASNQSDLVWSDERTLAGTTENIDLRGALTSQLSGAAVNFVEITFLAIWVKTTTSGYVLKAGGDTNSAPFFQATNDIVKIGAGGVFVLGSPVDGYAITAGTGDILKLDSGSDTITYQILVLGRSA